MSNVQTNNNAIYNDEFNYNNGKQILEILKDIRLMSMLINNDNTNDKKQKK